MGGWKFDHSNPNKEEQIKAWQTTGHTNILAKNGIEAFGWQYDPTNPLNKEEQKKAWKAQGHTNVLAKNSIEAFGDGIGWKYDPTNPLGKEEQKKAWQEQSHKNVLAKTACLNFGMRKLSVTSVASSWRGAINKNKKKELTEEDKQENMKVWKSDNTKKIASVANAFS